MDNRYGGVIWTNHALERMRERGIRQGDAWAVWKNPDQSKYAKSSGAWVYYKILGRQRVEVVAKKNEKREWIVLSVWSKPVGQARSGTVNRGKALLKLVKRLMGL